MAKVSIIVPIYNAEKYLEQCIESLVNQTYRDIEIILVDDGSKDNSGLICDKWTEQDARIAVIHKENAGASMARKAGITAASGQYICFLDSDDYAEPEFCQILLEQMLLHNADLAECAYSIFSETRKLEHLPWEKTMKLDKSDFCNTIVRQTIVTGTEAVVMWNKMYLRQSILDYVANYGEDVLEDYLFNMQYYCGVERYVYIPKCLVNYRQVGNSLSRRCNLKTFDILKKVDTEKTHCLQQMGLSSADDTILAAQWFVRYTYAFLTAYMQAPNNQGNSLTYRILQDPVLIDKCKIISQNHPWARLVASGRYHTAYKHLKHAVVHNRIKRKLAAMKAKLKG